jgi:hypothetical protein
MIVGPSCAIRGHIPRELQLYHREATWHNDERAVELDFPNPIDLSLKRWPISCCRIGQRLRLNGCFATCRSNPQTSELPFATGFIPVVCGLMHYASRT